MKNKEIYPYQLANNYLKMLLTKNFMKHLKMLLLVIL